MKTDEEILQQYEQLSHAGKSVILWIALDYMQQYNGRSRAECVKLAMCDKYDIKRDPNAQDYSR